MSDDKTNETQPTQPTQTGEAAKAAGAKAPGKAAKAKPAGSDVQEFEAVQAIRHDGVMYARGEMVPLDRASFDQLAAIGRIVGDWVD